MRSPLNPDLANVFMCSFEYKCLKLCPPDLKPVFSIRYVDDLHVLFSSFDHTERTNGYVSLKYPNINLSFLLHKLNLDRRQSFCATREFCYNVYQKMVSSASIKSLLFGCVNLCTNCQTLS